jgi:pimeloyl-ACP methyl ester carboxylesterase
MGVYEQVGELDMPVLLVWGEGDTTVPFKHSAAVLRAIPRAAFLPVAGTKHIPHYEAPEVVNPAVGEFLRE